MAEDGDGGPDHGGDLPPPGAVAVIFTSRRTAGHAADYAAAAVAMDAAAARQPGYLGMASARGEDGFGITISYWAGAAAALAWRADAEHAAVRALGRARWYEAYEVVVADVTRGYRWRRAPDRDLSTEQPPAPDTLRPGIARSARAGERDASDDDGRSGATD